MEHAVKMRSMAAGLLAGGVFLLVVGCGSQEKPGSSRPTVETKSSLPTGPGGSSESAVPQPPAESVPMPPSPPPPTTIPKVVMDEARRETFRIWVGDSLPDAPLKDLQGQTVTMRDLWGPKLTILVFWNSESLSGLQQLEDMAKDVLPKYQEKGVRVAAIHVGGDATAVQKTLPKAARNLPIFLDGDGAYFAQIAQQAAKTQIELLPRTYILDGEGKVLWLDLGYTESTLRAIETTIQVVTGEKAGVK